MPAAPNDGVGEGYELLERSGHSSVTIGELEEGTVRPEGKDEEGKKVGGGAVVALRPAAASQGVGRRGGSAWSKLKTADGTIRQDLLAQARTEAAAPTVSRNYSTLGRGGPPRLLSVVMSYRDSIGKAKDPSKEKRVRFKQESKQVSRARACRAQGVLWWRGEVWRR